MAAPVRVSSTSLHHQQTVSVRDFQFLLDEPEDLGGDNTGPTPMEVFLAGLGGCKTITLQMYAERKGWPLTHVSVDLAIQTVDGKTEIMSTLHLEGDLSEEQRQRLLKIAEKCPIHKLIAGETLVHTALAEG